VSLSKRRRSGRAIVPVRARHEQHHASAILGRPGLYVIPAAIVAYSRIYCGRTVERHPLACPHRLQLILASVFNLIEARAMWFPFHHRHRSLFGTLHHEFPALAFDRFFGFNWSCSARV
jgi:hypothetical protein